MKKQLKKPTKKQLERYNTFLSECGKNLTLTAEDLHNLYDLFYMITWQDYEKVFKPNKMDKWFKNFFDRIEKICLAKEKDYQDILKELMMDKLNIKIKKRFK